MAFLLTYQWPYLPFPASERESAVRYCESNPTRCQVIAEAIWNAREVAEEEETPLWLEASRIPAPYWIDRRESACTDVPWRFTGRAVATDRTLSILGPAYRALPVYSRSCSVTHFEYVTQLPVPGRWAAWSGVRRARGDDPYALITMDAFVTVDALPGLMFRFVVQSRA